MGEDVQMNDEDVPVFEEAKGEGGFKFTQRFLDAAKANPTAASILFGRKKPIEKSGDTWTLTATARVPRVLLQGYSNIFECKEFC